MIWAHRRLELRQRLRGQPASGLRAQPERSRSRTVRAGSVRSGTTVRQAARAQRRTRFLALQAPPRARRHLASAPFAPTPPEPVPAADFLPSPKRLVRRLRTTKLLRQQKNCWQDATDRSPEAADAVRDAGPEARARELARRFEPGSRCLEVAAFARDGRKTRREISSYSASFS